MNESDKPTGDVRLLADAMLGKLARWLRLLGYDTAYNPAWDDAAVARLARAEGRVVLTRDRVLSERRGLQALLLASDELEEQMAQIMNELHLPPAEAGSRCSICNTQLQPMAKAEVEGQVPPFVFRRQEEFHRCPRCDKIYWPGGHWARMQPVMNRLRDAGSRRQDAGRNA